MKKTILILALVATAIVTVTQVGCKKDDDTSSTTNTTPATSQDVINNFANKVAYATYLDLQVKANALNAAVTDLNTSTTADHLNTARTAWRSVRAAWEQNEAFLLGPVKTEDLDPSIDTWPVNRTELDSVLTANATYSVSFVAGLQESLKGFHPLEYLLFGTNGNKLPADFTAREKDYMVALGGYIKGQADKIRDSWDPAKGNFINEVLKAGSGSNTYPSQKALFAEMVDAMADICNEVANGKIEDPLVANDPSLEESPFSANSMIDFKNNIISVSNVYYGKYTEDGAGLNDLVAAKNKSLDIKIQGQITAAIASFNNVTMPFGTAISQQKQQLMQVQTALRALKETIEGDLAVFVQANIK